MAARAKGKFEIRKQRARYRATAEVKQFIIPYVGPYEALLANQPEIESQVSGFPNDYRVREVVIEEGRSIEGRMIVTIEKSQPGATGTTQNEQIGETIYECDWSEEALPLEEHKKCPDLNPARKAFPHPNRLTSSENVGFPVPLPLVLADPEQYRQRTWEDWACFDEDDLTGGEWSLTQYQSLKRKGYDTFPFAFPIARVTTYAKFRPNTTGGVFQLSSPPSACGAPSGWVYVKIGSRNQKVGRIYTLIDEWRGYGKFDPALAL